MFPPRPLATHDQPPKTLINVYNRSAWQTRDDNDGKRSVGSDNSSFPSDEPWEKGRT